MEQDGFKIEIKENGEHILVNCTSALELFEDEDTGERVPVARYQSYESEKEKEGLLDE